MKVYDAASIRNVALVGHSSSGKTQLAAAILSDAGMVNRFGKVDDGTTVTDFDEEEVARKHTLSSSLAFVEWQKTKINLIDTPGIGNFLSDACAALRVVDAAAVVVDAVAGQKNFGPWPTNWPCRGSWSSTGSIESAPASNEPSSRCAKSVTAR
jgi:elongation factor G